MVDSVRDVLNFLSSAGSHAQITVRNALADEVMLETSATVLSRGLLYNIVCKHVSPGVCLLTLKEAFHAG